MPKLGNRTTRFDPWGLYYDGVENLNKKKFDKAISIFNNLISKADPNNIVHTFQNVTWYHFF